MTARRCGGVFTPDPDVPADPYSLTQVCICRLRGRPGDAHHDLPDVPAQAEWRHRVDPADD